VATSPGAHLEPNDTLGADLMAKAIVSTLNDDLAPGGVKNMALVVNTAVLIHLPSIINRTATATK
jgi:hypothetical protein